MVKTYPGPNGQRWKKSDFERHFDGSKLLFERCWKRWLEYTRDISEINYDSDWDILQFLDERAAEEVNDERSPCYIWG
jgi:hypothetical protein